jgi:hypothetical protein
MTLAEQMERVEEGEAEIAELLASLREGVRQLQIAATGSLTETWRVELYFASDE